MNWFKRYAMARPKRPHDEIAGTRSGLIQHANDGSPLCDACLEFRGPVRQYTKRQKSDHGTLEAFRLHNLNGEKHCQECIDFMDANPELDAAECGTPEGYQRHIDQGYKPCNSCISAHGGE